MSDLPAHFRNSLLFGDCRRLCDLLPDESIDVIFTDPPYHEEFLWTWGWLGNEFARVLKPGGFLACYAGHNFLDQVYNSLSSGYLKYFWTFSIHQPESNSRIFFRKVFVHWRPVIVYYKPDPSNSKAQAAVQWVNDVHISKRDKLYHEWGQSLGPVEYYLSRLARPGAIVADPFCGGGTTAVAARRLGLDYVTFECSAEAYASARQRLAAVTMPLLPLSLLDFPRVLEPAA